VLQVKKLIDPGKTIAVGFAHESVTNHAHIKCLHGSAPIQINEIKKEYKKIGSGKHCPTRIQLTRPEQRTFS
jgi:hypothetical protein